MEAFGYPVSEASECTFPIDVFEGRPFSSACASLEDLLASAALVVVGWLADQRFVLASGFTAPDWSKVNALGRSGHHL